MSETKNPQDYAAFLESLKVNSPKLQEMHGIPFDYPMYEVLTEDVETWQLQEYLIARIAHAESNAKPSDLAEQVKGFMRAGMDAQSKSDNAMEKEGQHYWDEVSDEFRRLSEPD